MSESALKLQLHNCMVPFNIFFCQLVHLSSECMDIDKMFKPIVLTIHCRITSIDVYNVYIQSQGFLFWRRHIGDMSAKQNKSGETSTEYFFLNVQQQKWLWGIFFLQDLIWTWGTFYNPVRCFMNSSWSVLWTFHRDSILHLILFDELLEEQL